MKLDWRDAGRRIELIESDRWRIVPQTRKNEALSFIRIHSLTALLAL